MPLTRSDRVRLEHVAKQCETPCYVYFLDDMVQRCEALNDVFEGQIKLSYAVKSNPNVGVLNALREFVDYFDISSIAESEWVSKAGGNPAECSFTGPAKREFELRRAVKIGIREVVLEGLNEIDLLESICAEFDQSMDVLVRINPNSAPAKFGLQMSRKPTQFGFDEEDLEAPMKRLKQCEYLQFSGWHIYSGSNCLDIDAIADNFRGMGERFIKYSNEFSLMPKRLVFGAGFGVPYLPNEKPLTVKEIAKAIPPILADLKKNDYIGGAECLLELGRWIVGSSGYLITKIIGEKLSRGSEIRMCDAGFNNHLSAFGMMGTVIRRNWNIHKLNEQDDDQSATYMLVGPLCSTIDQLANDIELPSLKIGDHLAIAASGAYGYTASPDKFISHPPASEVLYKGDKFQLSPDQWQQFDWSELRDA